MTDQVIVHECRAMIAGMKPALRSGNYCFCTTTDDAVWTACAAKSLMIFREDEGVTLILENVVAAEYGFDTSQPMRRIVLEVFSALDGVGLTAAVSGELARHGISCNVVAAFHHDNIFVPEVDGDKAIKVLQNMQKAARAVRMNV